MDEIIRDPVGIGEGKSWTYQSVRLVGGETQFLGIHHVWMGFYREMNIARGDLWSIVGLKISPCIIAKPPLSAAFPPAFAGENNGGGYKPAMA